MKKKSFKFVAKSERPMNSDQMELLKIALVKFNSDETNVVILPSVTTVAVFDENNKFITIL